MRIHLMLVIAPFVAACATAPETFDSPEAAVQALVDGDEDQTSAEHLLGPGGIDLLCTGDTQEDCEDLETVRAMYAQKVAFEERGPDCRIALLGDEAWPLPLPIVRNGTGWCFDVDAGRQEILNRRIGRNELLTIETLRACVAAQDEYAAAGRDGKPREFAARLASGAGRHDGLFWPASDGEPRSPIGPMVADAAFPDPGSAPAGEAVPYHGYYFRVLTAQGPHAPGGARSYEDEDGRLVRGFAFLAWPAAYGDSGIMTFVVNRQGIVFQRDLGADTAAAVQKIHVYDPDDSWLPVAN